MIRTRIRTLALLLFPAVVAVALSVPVLVPGALAFDMQADFDLRPGEIGGLVALFYLLSTLATQAVVPLTARFSPMWTSRFGLILCGASVLLTATRGTEAGLWAMCTACGVANGLATPSANMLIALTVPTHRQGLAFGLRMSAVPAAAGLTAIGAVVAAHSTLGWRSVLLALTLTCALVLAASFVGSSAHAKPSKAGDVAQRGDGLHTLRLLAIGGLLAATACSTLSPFLVEGLIAGGADPGAAAVLLGISAWLGVTARVGAGLLGDRLANPTRNLVVAAAMLAMAALGMIGLGHGSGLPVLAAATLLTFSIGWAWPGLLQQASIALHPTLIPQATTYMQVGTFLGALLGPLAFGLLVEATSYRVSFSVSALAAAGSAAVILLVRRLELAALRTREPSHMRILS